MTNKQLIVLASSVATIVVVALGLRWQSTREPVQSDTTESAGQPAGTRLSPLARPGGGNTPAATPDSADDAQADSSTDEDDVEDFDPYASCDAIDDADAWVSCTDEIDAKIEALEDACDKYEDDRWDDCTDAAARLQPYSPPQP